MGVGGWWLVVGAQGFGFGGLGFGFWGLVFGVWGLVFGVWGLGWWVAGLGFKVWGLRSTSSFCICGQKAPERILVFSLPAGSSFTERINCKQRIVVAE